MRILFTLSSLIYLTNTIYALEISKQELANTFEENCKQSINSGISIANDNINVCNFVYLNNFPKKSKEKLKKLNDEMIQLKEDILFLKNKKNTTVINKKEITIIENKKTDLSKIERELENLKKIAIQNNKIIKDVQKRLRQEYQEQLQGIKKEYQIILTAFQETIQEVKELKKEVNLLKSRVGVLEEKDIKKDIEIEGIKVDVKGVEEKTDKNTNFIEEYLKNINEHFGGLNPIGATSLENNPNNTLAGLAVEYEGYNPDNDSYIFGNIFYGKFENKLKYKTLAQASEIQKNSEKLWAGEIGYRQLFTTYKFSSLTPYASLSTGYISSDGDGNNFLAKASLGIEHQYKSDKVLLEMGYSYMGIEQTDEIVFNPLGESSSKTKDNVSLPFISLKYLRRF